MQEWIRVLLQSKQKKLIQGVFAVLGDRGTSLRCKENAAWILRRATEFSDTAKTLVAGTSSPTCMFESPERASGGGAVQLRKNSALCYRLKNSSLFSEQGLGTIL